MRIHPPSKYVCQKQPNCRCEKCKAIVGPMKACNCRFDQSYGRKTCKTLIIRQDFRYPCNINRLPRFKNWIYADALAYQIWYTQYVQDAGGTLVLLQLYGELTPANSKYFSFSLPPASIFNEICRNDNVKLMHYQFWCTRCAFWLIESLQWCLVQKKLEIRKTKCENFNRVNKNQTDQCHEIESNPSKDRSVCDWDNRSFWNECIKFTFLLSVKSIFVFSSKYWRIYILDCKDPQRLTVHQRYAWEG
jgi:hypothetical protein